MAKKSFANGPDSLATGLPTLARLLYKVLFFPRLLYTTGFARLTQPCHARRSQPTDGAVCGCCAAGVMVMVMVITCGWLGPQYVRHVGAFGTGAKVAFGAARAEANHKTTEPLAPDLNTPLHPPRQILFHIQIDLHHPRTNTAANKHIRLRRPRCRGRQGSGASSGHRGTERSAKAGRPRPAPVEVAAARARMEGGRQSPLPYPDTSQVKCASKKNGEEKIKKGRGPRK